MHESINESSDQQSQDCYECAIFEIDQRYSVQGSSVFQFVLVALARAGMIFISKKILDKIIAKKEFIRKQREHSARQKEQNLEQKMKVMQ